MDKLNELVLSRAFSPYAYIHSLPHTLCKICCHFPVHAASVERISSVSFYSLEHLALTFLFTSFLNSVKICCHFSVHAASVEPMSSVSLYSLEHLALTHVFISFLCTFCVSDSWWNGRHVHECVMVWPKWIWGENEVDICLNKVMKA